MKDIIFNDWNFMRIFRFVLGIIILIQALKADDKMMLFFGALFIILPLFNLGCCGSSCAPTFSKEKSIKKEFNYEEVK
jgi:hypothetical protein